MIETIDDLSAASLARFDEIIDVRSPAEYAEDRLPGAVNLPVLDDAQRAEVGTIYVQESRFLARRIGAALVARNVARHLETALAGKPAQFRPLLYCWRGGQRSQAMATILSQIGWRVGVVEGGYRRWRRDVAQALRESAAPLKLVLIDGQTGTAKSRLLAHLARAGLQTIDLEELAAHRGSVFGATSAAQPSQKLFESRLYAALRGFDPQQWTIVEAESAKIGRIATPPRLWRAMQTAPCIEIAAPLHARAAHLLAAYADMTDDPARITASLDRLAPFHSRETLEAWRALVEAGDYAELATALMTAHYDPLYDRSRRRRTNSALMAIRIERLDEEGLAAAADRIRTALARVAGGGCAPGEFVLPEAEVPA